MGATGDRSGGWLVKGVAALMALFLTLVGYSAGVSSRASDAAQEAIKKADKVAADMSIHEARQNGSLEKIESQLGTLRTYHSTLRGEFKDQNKVLDELLRHSYANPRPRVIP